MCLFIGAMEPASRACVEPVWGCGSGKLPRRDRNSVVPHMSSMIYMTPCVSLAHFIRSLSVCYLSNRVYSLAVCCLPLNPKVDTPLCVTNYLLILYNYTILPGRKSWPLRSYCFDPNEPIQSLGRLPVL